MIEKIVFNPSNNDLEPFTKGVISRTRSHFARVAGEIGEMLAIKYLKSHGFEVCKVDEHRMMQMLYPYERYDGGLKISVKDPSLKIVKSEGYKIPTVDMLLRWDRHYYNESHGFCDHIDRDSASQVIIDHSIRKTAKEFFLFFTRQSAS